MKKREIIITVIIILFSIVVLYTYKGNQNKKFISVNYVNGDDKHEIIKIDLSIDDTYKINVDLGEMVIEVKDEKYAVIEVDCPQHICQSQGFVSVDDISPMIVCLPNHIVIEPS